MAASRLVDARTLSAPERLLLHRRRLGKTQEEMARRWRVAPTLYTAYETGERQFRRAVPPLGSLTLQEQCIIRRRRANLLQQEVASALGCSRFWVMRMETGEAPVDRLVEFWASRA